MGDHSQDEQALMKIQHEWAEARLKNDSSYTQRLEAEDCTIVWPDGSIVNQRADLQSMTDIAFSEFKIRNYRHICETGWTLESRCFADHSSLGKIIADVYP